jgi:hypothetical protein
MGFLSGPLTFECFRIIDSETRQFGPEHVEILERFAVGQIETASLEEAQVGFLAGEHLFDHDFSLEKNVIADALHCAVRIDVNQIPSAVRKAWLQMEVAATLADAPEGRLTKAQRQQAKEAVEARCEEEARSGRFRRMQQLPVLWDAQHDLIYFGCSSSTASEHCADLFGRAFELELGRLTAGRRAQEWAAEAKRRKALEEIQPAPFHADAPVSEIAWCNNESGNFDFLGNEFLLWLWWRWETQSDTLELPDGSEVTGMLTRTLRLECPRGESGKETITAEAPTSLPEAALAIRSGKLPRKVGLSMVRHGEQYEAVLQPETFSVSGAKIYSEGEGEADGRGILEDRIESLRGLHETLTLMFHAFCEQRVGKSWHKDLEPMQRWLKASAAPRRKSAGSGPVKE